MRKFSFLLMALFTFSSAALAEHYSHGSIHVMQPWALEVPPVSDNGAAYFEIQNQGGKDDILLSADSPRAAVVEIHEHVHRDGVMKMQKVDALPVQAGALLRFSPGGYHLMLMGLKQPLKAGQRIPVTLHFKESGDLPVEVEIVQQMPATSGMHHH